MRLPSFFSGVFFWPVSESNRGKVRITFMFLSRQLVTSCRFPAPWVDSSFVNSERASQPASNVSCERRTSFSPSLSLLLALLLPCCPHSPSTTLSSLSLSLLPPRPPCRATTAPKTGSTCLSPQTRLTSIRAPPLWMQVQEDKRKMDSARKQEGAEV